MRLTEVGREELVHRFPLHFVLLTGALHWIPFLVKKIELIISRSLWNGLSSKPKTRRHWLRLTLGLLARHRWDRVPVNPAGSA